MDRDRELTLLSLLEWRERQQRCEAVPSDARREFVAELARLMVRQAVRERDDDGTDHD